MKLAHNLHASNSTIRFTWIDCQDTTLDAGFDPSFTLPISSRCDTRFHLRLRRAASPAAFHLMEFDETFKILLVGDSGVGKSSILLRFTDDVFEAMQPTIGVDFKVKAMKVDNRRVKMTIWDT